MDGHWLTQARRQKGWTQERAAARLRVSQTYLSLLENNRRTVSRRLIRKLQREFEVPATQLPVEPQDDASDARTVANALGRLGYQGLDTSSAQNESIRRSCSSRRCVCVISSRG